MSNSLDFGEFNWHSVQGFIAVPALACSDPIGALIQPYVDLHLLNPLLISFKLHLLSTKILSMKMKGTAISESIKYLHME